MNRFEGGFWRVVIVAVLIMVSQTVRAHPGHSLGEHGLLHVVTSPFHLLLLGAAGVALWGAASFVSHTVARRFLRFGAAAAVGASIVLWSFAA